ncbi:hypothetical protein PUG42_19600 [Erwiniaceae bacterium L1_54_3]|nr:hypothetical protein [Erwiniaceae bacterium L1_54_3]
MFERQKILKEEFRGSSDRASAIVGAAFLDELLTEILKEYLVDDTIKNDKEIFSGVGPLATFSSKINMAYRLGIISKSERKIIHCIRDVRNKFAHKLDGVSFEENSIRQKVQSIEIPINLLIPSDIPISSSHDTEPLVPTLIKASSDDIRGVFQESVIHMFNCLTGRQSVIRKIKPEEAKEYTTAHQPIESLILLAELGVRDSEAMLERIKGKTFENQEVELNETISTLNSIIRVTKYIRDRIIITHEKQNYKVG